MSRINFQCRDQKMERKENGKSEFIVWKFILKRDSTKNTPSVMPPPPMIIIEYVVCVSGNKTDKQNQKQQHSHWKFHQLVDCWKIANFKWKKWKWNSRWFFFFIIFGTFYILYSIEVYVFLSHKSTTRINLILTVLTNLKYHVHVCCVYRVAAINASMRFLLIHWVKCFI